MQIVGYAIRAKTGEWVTWVPAQYEYSFGPGGWVHFKVDNELQDIYPTKLRAYGAWKSVKDHQRPDVKIEVVPIYAPEVK